MRLHERLFCLAGLEDGIACKISSGLALVDPFVSGSIVSKSLSKLWRDLPQARFSTYVTIGLVASGRKAFQV